jgi:hypothetical protein
LIKDIIIYRGSLKKRLIGPEPKQRCRARRDQEISVQSERSRALLHNQSRGLKCEMMSAEAFEHLTSGIINILTIAAVGLVGLWAYTRYVIERGLLPPAQFDLECTNVGHFDDDVVIDIGIHLKNLGSSSLGGYLWISVMQKRMIHRLNT